MGNQKKKKKKIYYELRCFIDNNISMVVKKFDDKENAIKLAEDKSKHADNRIYFVKKVIEQIIFFVGEHG